MNIYGKEIEVEFIKRIRDEKKFKDYASLLAQIKKDKLVCEKIF